MPQIVPAILEDTKAQFAEKMSRIVVLPGVERMQVDFSDGKLVPRTSLPIGEIDLLNPAFHWEAHLMVSQPEEFLDYKISGFGTVIIHLEAYQSSEQLLKALDKIREQQMKCGLAINPKTPVASLKDYIHKADQFTLLSVDPGFQGQQFIQTSLERITELRRLAPDAIIEVDGGLNETNLYAVAAAGADLLVVGSAMYKGNTAEIYQNLSHALFSK